MEQHDRQRESDTEDVAGLVPGLSTGMTGTLDLARQIMQHTREGIMVMDVRGRILEANEAFCRHCELDAGELTGRHITELGQGLHERRYYRQIWQQLQQSGRWQGEVQHSTRSGQTATHWMMLRLLRDAQGVQSHIIGILDDVSELRRSEERLSYLAHHDSLTGVANRESLLGWFRRVRAELPPGDQLALLFIDLDRFKPINDGFGHDVGDGVLRAQAGRLQEMVDENEMVARIGGDEFVVVLRGIHDEAQLLARAGKLLERLEAPLRIEQHELSVGASVGISLYPRHGLEIDTLLRYADSAMYEAKSRCHSHIALFDSVSFARLEQRTRLARDFRDAFEQQQLFLEYQPRLRLQDGTLHGVEALLRWQHPVKGVIWPETFLPAARDAGLLGRLTEWVFTSTARQLRTWQQQGWRGRISLNLNGLEPQLDQPRILQLLEILQAEGADPGCFELELHSDFIMRRCDSLHCVLRDFRKAGMAVYLDNVGQGRLNFSTLKTLPVDGIKLDRGLLAEPLEEFEQAVIRSLLLLGETQGLVTVACGVETAAQLEFLRRHGCAQIQGRLVAAPLSPERVPGFMAVLPDLPGSVSRG